MYIFPRSIIRLSHFPILFILFFFFQGCTLNRMVKTGAAKQQVTAEPKLLEVNGDNVLFEVKSSIPAELTHKKPVYNISLVYKYGKLESDFVTNFKFITGEYVYENGQPTITRQLSFPYSSLKSNGRLMAQGYAVEADGKSKYGKPFEIARGILATSKLTEKANPLTLTPDNYREESNATETLTFYFDFGNDTIRNFLGTNVDVLFDFIQSNQLTESVDIIGGHSPDETGPKQQNLAYKRARMLERYYRHQLNVNSYKNSNESVRIRKIPVVKNWDRFLKQVQVSALKPEQINEILELINAKGSFTEKAEKLTALPYSDYLETFIYPTLRNADVKISYTKQQRKDYEIYLLSKKITQNEEEPDALTEEEMRYAATLTPLLSEKLNIYKTAVVNYRKWQSFNNLGVTYMQLAEKTMNPTVQAKLYAEGIKNLTMASHRNPTAQLFYNLASAHHKKGNSLEALQAYDYAIKLGGPLDLLQQVFADKAALEIEIGQLDDAYQSLQYSAENYQHFMNKGLLYLLKENYEEAAGFYEKALMFKPESGLAHYCLAVIGARKKDEGILALNLKKAVQADKTFASKAIEDLEFINFHKTLVFEEALR